MLGNTMYTDLIDTINSVLSIMNQKTRGILRVIMIDDDEYFYNEKNGNVFSVKKYQEEVKTIEMFMGMSIDEDDDSLDRLKNFRSELTERCFSLALKYNIRSYDDEVKPIRNPELFVYIDSIVGRNKDLDEDDLVNRKRQVLTRQYVDFLRAKYIEAYYDEDFGDLTILESKMQRLGYVYQESVKEARFKHELINRIQNLYQFLGRNENVDRSLSLEVIASLYNQLLKERDIVVTKWQELEKVRKQYIRLCRLASNLIDVNTTDDILYSYDLETLKNKIQEIKDFILYNDEQSKKIKDKRLYDLWHLYIELVYDAEHRIPLPDEYGHLSFCELMTKCVDYCDEDDYRLTEKDSEEWRLRNKMEDRLFDLLYKTVEIEGGDVGSGPSQYESYDIADFEEEINDVMNDAMDQSVYDNSADEKKLQIITHICNEYKKHGLVRCPSQFEIYSIPSLETISNLVDNGVLNAEDFASEVIVYK